MVWPANIRPKLGLIMKPASPKKSPSANLFSEGLLLNSFSDGLLFVTGVTFIKSRFFFVLIFRRLVKLGVTFLNIKGLYWNLGLLFVMRRGYFYWKYGLHFVIIRGYFYWNYGFLFQILMVTFLQYWGVTFYQINHCPISLPSLWSSHGTTTSSSPTAPSQLPTQTTTTITGLSTPPSNWFKCGPALP